MYVWLNVSSVEIDQFQMLEGPIVAVRVPEVRKRKQLSLFVSSECKDM